MNKNYVYQAALVLGLLYFSACSTVPKQRVHGAVSIPRLVDINKFNFMDAGENKGGLGGGGGVGQGIAYSDAGNAYGSRIFHAGVHYRTPEVAFGWTPYFGNAQVSHEGTNVLGSVLWAAAHFGGGNRWRYSFQGAFAMANKVTEDKGCEKDRGFFFAGCSGEPTSSTRAETRVKDVGFLITADHNLGHQSSLVIVPAAYWTSISASNQLDYDHSGDYVRRSSFWSPALQLGFVKRFGGNLLSAFSILAGAQWTKTFRPGHVVREWLPTVDAKFQF